VVATGGQRADARDDPGAAGETVSQRERALLRALPAIPFDTDEVVPAVVNSLARIEFDGNRYSTPPQWVSPARHDSRQP